MHNDNQVLLGIHQPPKNPQTTVAAFHKINTNHVHHPYTGAVSLLPGPYPVITATNQIRRANAAIEESKRRKKVKPNPTPKCISSSIGLFSSLPSLMNDERRVCGNNNTQPSKEQRIKR